MVNCLSSHIKHQSTRDSSFFFVNVVIFTRDEHLTILLLDFSLAVKAATLIFISGCGSDISSAKEGKSGFIYNSVKS